jgi:sugar lactone lactonase YvrE
MDSGIGTSNGIAWNLDGHTLYFTDSPLKVIYAYDFDPQTGNIENRRPFIHTPDEAGFPDGLIVDSEGFLWSARWGGWKINRYDPAGKKEREVAVPAEFPTSCAFGGRDLTDLYITSAWTELGRDHHKVQPLSGDIFLLHTEIRGQVEPKFAG